MACCSNPVLPSDYEDDFSVKDGDAVSTDVSGSSASGTQQLTTPYSRCTPLFQAIEQEDWQSILLFLNTAKWSNSMWNSTVDHLKSPAPHIQCKTWVISYKLGKEEWCQLPIHAAISYGAPAVVVQKLVETYPECVQQRDGEGMLPIHLAFGFGSNDTVLGFLLRSWPASVSEAGPGGRLPHECCDLGPNKSRGEVFRIVAEQTGHAVQQSHDDLWMRCVVANSERLGLQEQQLQKRHLTDLLTELLEDRAQLQELKEKLKMKYGATSSKNNDMLRTSPTSSRQASSSLKINTATAGAVSTKSMSSPKAAGSELRLVSPPKGHGSNPPWMIQAASTPSPTNTKGLTVHAPLSPKQQQVKSPKAATPAAKSTKSKKGLLKRSKK